MNYTQSKIENMPLSKVDLNDLQRYLSQKGYDVVKTTSGVYHTEDGENVRGVTFRAERKFR